MKFLPASVPHNSVKDRNDSESKQYEVVLVRNVFGAIDEGKDNVPKG